SYTGSPGGGPGVAMRQPLRYQATMPTSAACRTGLFTVPSLTSPRAGSSDPGYPIALLSRCFRRVQPVLPCVYRLELLSRLAARALTGSAAMADALRGGEGSWTPPGQVTVA